MTPILQGWLKQNLLLKYLQLLEVVHGTHHLGILAYLLKPLVVGVELPLLMMAMLDREAVVLVLEGGLPLKLLVKR